MLCLETAEDYTHFRPQALATHPALSLLALNGPLGIAVSRIAATPTGNSSSESTRQIHHRQRLDQMLVLRHVTADYSVAAINSLKFAPSRADLKLASAMGSGLTLWDVSGHTNVPLLARLSVRNDHGSVSCISWMKSSNEILAAAKNQVTMFDVRSVGAGCSPVLYFNSGGNSPLCYVDCNDQNQVGTMDQSGYARIYDLRYGSYTSGSSSMSSSKLLATFMAHEGRGVGISPFTANDNIKEPAWITWGCNRQGEGCAKLWLDHGNSGSISKPPSIEREMYWYEGDITQSPFNRKGKSEALNVTESETRQSQSGRIKLNTRFGEPSTSCVRLCPAGVVTVRNDSISSFTATLWSIENGSATSVVQQKINMAEDLSSICGHTLDDVGHLLGAEVVAGPSYDGNNGSSTRDVHLCCLSSNGYVSTYSIPEASIREQRPSPTVPNGTKRQGHKVSLFRHRRDSLSSSHSPRRATSEREDAIQRKTSSDQFGDNFWNGPSFTGEESGSSLFDFTQKNSFGTTAKGIEMGTQFDMDNVLFDATKDASISLSVGVNDPKLSAGVDEDKRIDLAKAAHIPCPRICGASFGSGDGSLITFRNGKIQSMWSWFASDEYRRSLNMTDSTAVKFKHGRASGLHSNLSKERRHPRTMSDLLDMLNAAKKAQWGEDENTDSGSQSSEEYDDSTDDDVDETESQDRDSADELSKINSKAAVDTSPNSMPSVQGNIVGNMVLNRRNHADSGLGAEPLMPVVDYRVYNDLVMNGQNYQLSQGWKLGDWWRYDECEMSIDDGPREEVEKSNKGNGSTSPYRILFQRQASYPNESEIEDSQSLSGPTVRRLKSDLSLDTMTELSQSLPDKLTDTKLLQNTDGLLKKSNMVESSVLNGGQTRTRATLTKELTCGIPHSFNVEYTDRIDDSKSDTLDSPVRTIPRPSDLSESDMMQVSNMEEVCLHNASVCYDHNQPDKGDVWTVLAQVVVNAFCKDTDVYSGWRRAGGGALGRELITEFLNHFEAQGDFQMCATIVCVLKQKGTSSNSTSSYFLQNSLLPENNVKYNNYMYLYANMLYLWGQITTRAEILKHLSLPGNFGISKSNEFHESRVVKDDWNTKRRVGGISIAPWCPRCDKPASYDTNVCGSCKDFAFRCSICDNAVRGLFTMCMNCGHGGHSEHILPWFAQFNDCPTGCGCKCTLETFRVRERWPSKSPATEGQRKSAGRSKLQLMNILS